MKTRADLRLYQQHAIDFVKTRDNCALWVSMGLGKTISALTAFKDLKDTFDCRRALVVAPLRVARRVWSDEITEWAHLQGLTLARVVGSADQRVAALRKPADIHTINRENLVWLERLFIKDKKQVLRWPWDLVILDESSSFKSQSAQRYKSMKRLRKLFPRMVQLTGTPAPNGIGDVWAQIFLLDGGLRLGATETAFRERWFKPPGWNGIGAKWTPRKGAEAEIGEILRDIVLTLREEDYLDLPPIVRNVIRVTLPEKAMDTYKIMERDSLLELANKVITAANAGVLWGKLLQIANGALYLGEDRKWQLVHNAKLDALGEVLDDTSGPVIIAHQFISDRERLAAWLPVYCKANGKSWALLDKQDHALDLWKNGKLDYIVLHPASAGHGLNDLQRKDAETIVHFGNGPNLEFHDQLNARLGGGHRRVGKNLVIHYLVAENTMDEDALALLTTKGASQRDLIASVQRKIAAVCGTTLVCGP